MKKILSLFLFLLPVFLSAQNGDKNFIDQNYIEVTGKAELDVAPDLIYIKIVLNENDKGKLSIEELESRMIESLKSLGIDIEKDLTLKDLSSNFHIYLLIKSDIVLLKEYILTVRDAKNAAKVFLELQKAGISNLSIDKVENSEIERYQKEVKIMAIKAAKDKAAELTEAIGQSIGKALFIQEMSPMEVYRTESNVMIRGSSSLYGSSASVLPNIEFEKLKLTYSIKVRFELK